MIQKTSPKKKRKEPEDKRLIKLREEAAKVIKHFLARTPNFRLRFNGKRPSRQYK